MTRRIPAAEGLRPLPDVPCMKNENERVADYMNNQDTGLTLEGARSFYAGEYGFANWDDFVDYIAMCDHHTRSGTSPYNLSMDRVEQEFKSTLKQFNSRKMMAEPPPDGMGILAAVATYVPRFYGLSDDEMLNEALTDDEARLVVARQRRFMNWLALMEKVEEAKKYDTPEFRVPMPEVLEVKRAVEECDLERITRTFHERPKLFHLPLGAGILGGFAWDAIRQHVLTPSAKTRALFDHLRQLGVDVQAHLDNGLTGYGNWPMQTGLVRGLLELGANPRTVPAEVTVVEFLLRRGADRHYKAWPNFWSAMDASKQFLDHGSDKAGAVAIHAMMTR